MEDYDKFIKTCELWSNILLCILVALSLIFIVLIILLFIISVEHMNTLVRIILYDDLAVAVVALVRAIIEINKGKSVKERNELLRKQ